jgi:Predicted signal transduction protein with a C-terminal ATPase domain
MLERLFSNLKMKSKMNVISILSIVMVWSVVVSVSIFSMQRMYSRKIDRIIKQTVEQTSNYVSAEYSNILNLVHYSVMVEDIQRALRRDVNASAREYIEIESVVKPVLTQLQVQNAFIDSTGMYFGGSWFYGDNYIMSYDTDEIFEKVINNPLIYWSTETIYNKSTKREVLPVVIRVPIGTFYSQNEAYLVVNINAKKIFEYFNSLEENLECYLVLHKDDTVIYGDKELYKNKNTGNYIFNNTTISINNWELSCIMNKSEIYEDMYHTMFIMFTISVVIALISIVIIHFVSKTITKPIQQLKEQAKKMEQGDFSVRTNILGNDEIGDLGYSFNAMTEQIQKYMNQIEQTAYEKRKAEMQVLQSQINPHFLYNTLDSLYWFSISGKKEEVGAIVYDLSALLRIGLSKGAESILIQDEIAHVENYLKIQKIIFSDKFIYEIEYDDSVLSYPIIKILLQPLAENSLNHGFTNMESGGIIKISLREQAEELIIVVTDNGCGFNIDENNNETHKYNGYALKNIMERLRLHYGEDIQLEIYSKSYVETTVKISIPISSLLSTADMKYQ